MRIQLTATAIAITFLAAACGSTPAPTPPTPTVVSISVTSPNVNLLLGSVEQMAASATLSNGTSQTPTGTWGSDNMAVATVSSTGLVTTIASGQATIFFDASGTRGTKAIRVLPNYAGNWTGNYAVTSCSSAGLFLAMNSCALGFPTGQVLPYTMTLTQSAATVSGRFTVGTVRDTLVFDQTSAPISLNGELVFTSRSSIAGATIDVTWRLNSLAAGRLTGTHTQFYSNGSTDTMTVNSTVQDATRSLTGR